MTMKRTIAILLTAIIACATACDSKKPATSEGATGEAHEEHHDDHAKEEHGDEHAGEKHGHAPSGFEPGSHEDWCGEHAVPESMCTRCNKTLIAGFKATGDWCDEHELPKSHCLACNPDLKIERPPKKVTQ